MSKTAERQRLIRAYRDETGETEIDMRKVAEYAVSKGWPLPPPSDPLDNLAKLFADAARIEIRQDPKTGNPYRANWACYLSGGRSSEPELVSKFWRHELSRKTRNHQRWTVYADWRSYRDQFFRHYCHQRHKLFLRRHGSEHRRGKR